MVALFQMLVSFVNGKFLKRNGLSSDALPVFRRLPVTKTTNCFQTICERRWSATYDSLGASKRGTFLLSPIPITPCPPIFPAARALRKQLDTLLFSGLRKEFLTFPVNCNSQSERQ